jgi:hypothetical protein
MQPDQPDLATALAKHLCEFEACSDPAPCPDHLTVAGVALKFLGADVDAAYQRGLADGRTQAEAAEPLTTALTDVALADVHRWHAIVHPALADRGVYEPERNPSGCDRFFCLTHVVECSAVAAPRWYDAGRTQATEGWEREWGTQWATDSSLGTYPCDGEAEARQHVERYPGNQVVSRLVGPWEPAEQPTGSDR